MNLTPKQLKIMKLVRDGRVRRGYSPTMQELADELGVSKVTVFEHVESLIKKGALIREPNKARSLSIAEGVAVPDESRPLRFPLVGRIAAGYPIEKVADQDEFDLTELLAERSAKAESTYALKLARASDGGAFVLGGLAAVVRRSWYTIPMVCSGSPSTSRLTTSTPCISVWSVLATSYFHMPKRPRL
jgi:repressor LexA